jgi:hypothetical protein
VIGTNLSSDEDDVEEKEKEGLPKNGGNPVLQSLKEEERDTRARRKTTTKCIGTVGEEVLCLISGGCAQGGGVGSGGVWV